MVPCYQMLHPKFSGPEIDPTVAPCSPLGCSRPSQHGKFMDTTYRNLVLQCKDFKYYNHFAKLSTLICSTREPLVLSCLPNAAARSYNNKRRYMKLYEGRDMISSLTSLTNLQPLGQQPRTPDAFYNTIPAHRKPRPFHGGCCIERANRRNGPAGGDNHGKVSGQSSKSQGKAWDGMRNPQCPNHMSITQHTEHSYAGYSPHLLVGVSESIPSRDSRHFLGRLPNTILTERVLICPS